MRDHAWKHASLLVLPLLLAFALLPMGAASDLEADLVFFDDYEPVDRVAGQSTSPVGGPVDLSILSELVILDDEAGADPRNDLVAGRQPSILEKTLAFEPPAETTKPEVPLAALAELVPAADPSELLADIVGGQDLPATTRTGEQLVTAEPVAPLHSLADLILWNESGDPILDGDLVPSARTDRDDLAVGSTPASGGTEPELLELAAIKPVGLTSGDGVMAPAAPGVLPSRPLASAAGAPPHGDPEISRAQVSARRLEALCREGELGQALRIYNSMPRFGGNGWVNKYRTDSANLLVLHLCREGRLDIARRVYNTMPGYIPGDSAMVGKARAALNLAAFYIKEDDIEGGFGLFSDLPAMVGIDETLPEVYKLTARMIPYLDNAGAPDKAAEAHAYLLSLTTTRETAQLYADCVPSLTRYLLGRPGSLVADPGQINRQELMENIFDTLVRLGDDDVVKRTRLEAAEAMGDYYEKTGNAEKAAAMRALTEAAAHAALWE